MSRTISRITGSVLICFCLVLIPAAQAKNLPDPDAMASHPLPEHDPDAMLDGKTALGHAEDISADGGTKPRAALQALARMGVDALPARAVVRAYADEGGPYTRGSKEDDDLKVNSLSVLAAMCAPEAEDLLRQKIMDPDYLTHDRSYEILLTASGQIGVDHDTLVQDMIFLVETAPDHASRLMVIDALEAPVQSALHEAVFRTDHDQAATRHFLANLPALRFLDDAAKVDYLLVHRELAARQHQQTQEVLAGIGTDAALEAALRLDGDNGVERHLTISRFVRGPMSLDKILDNLLAEARARSSRQDVGRVISSLESMVRDRTDDAGARAERAEHLRLFVDAMGSLIADGPSDVHSVTGIQRQVLFQQRHEDAPLAPALDPIFDLFEAAGSPAVQTAAARALLQSPARIAAGDPEYFVDRSLALLWTATTPELAELPVGLLSALMRSPDHVELVVDRIAEQVDEHQDGWSVNPATAVVTVAGTIGGLDFSSVREKAGGVMGKALASRALDMDYLGPHLARGGGALAVLESNSVEGVIAVFTPNVFAEEKPVQYGFPMESFMQPMLGRPAWLQRDPDSLESWIAFLEEVEALDDPDFSPTARQALQAWQ